MAGFFSLFPSEPRRLELPPRPQTMQQRAEQTARRTAERTTEHSQQPGQIHFNHLPCEIKTQIFRELLLLRYMHVTLKDEGDLYQDVYAFVRTEKDDSYLHSSLDTDLLPPSTANRRGLFHLDESMLRPQRQPMHPALLRVCRHWRDIGSRILALENILLAVEDSYVMHEDGDIFKHAKARGLFCPRVSSLQDNVKPIMILESRYIAPRSTSQRSWVIFDPTWAAAIIRYMALSYNRLKSAPAGLRGNLYVHLEAENITAFRPRDKVYVIVKLFAESIYPLFAGHIQRPYILGAGRQRPTTPLSRSFPMHLPRYTGLHFRDISKSFSLHYIADVVEVFLTDLRDFHLHGRWPARRHTDSFELLCTRVHSFLCHIDLAYKHHNKYLEVLLYLQHCVALFNLLLGIMTVDDTLPPTFHNLSGSTPVQRLAAGRALIRSAFMRLHGIEKDALMDGMIARPRRILRSYAGVLCVLECIKMRLPESAVEQVLSQAYKILITEGMTESMIARWMDEKDNQLSVLFAECMLTAHRGVYRRHWGCPQSGGLNIDLKKLRSRLMKHWDETRAEADLEGDIFEVPRFQVTN